MIKKTKLTRIAGIFCIALLGLISPALACMEETAEAGNHSTMTGAVTMNNSMYNLGALGLIEQLLIIIVLVLLIIFLVRKISRK